MAKKHGFHTTHIEHHKDGSATVHHKHMDGAHKDVKHAVQSLDHIHDSLQDHLGEPNPGEAEANAGMHGVPPAQAGPAGLPPAPPPAGPAGPMGPVGA